MILEQIPNCQEMKGKYINNVECVADFKDLSEFKHKKKAGRMNKTCRRCLDRSREYHRRKFIMIQNNIIAEENN